MKRILVIAPYPYLPHYSGGQKTIAQFAEYLAKETELTVISAKKNQASLVNGYRLLSWLMNAPVRYLDVLFYFKLSRLLKKEQFDCIIWEHPYFHWLGRAIQRKFGLLTIIHAHNIEYQRFRSTGKWWWPILRRYERKCLQKADYTYFLTPEDRNTAIRDWQLEPTRTDLLPLGIRQIENPTDRTVCQDSIRQRHQIPKTARILFFNGLLNYTPNRQALDILLKEINPRLLRSGLEYKLVICGKGLPTEYRALTDYAEKNIIYAGFVDDIDSYFKAADVFLNPILSGGGIKTKMVEAIGLGTTVVSTKTGATGILEEICGEKLQIVPDMDWNSFTELVVRESAKMTITPSAYYHYYFWGQIVKKVPALLNQLSTKS